MCILRCIRVSPASGHPTLALPVASDMVHCTWDVPGWLWLACCSKVPDVRGCLCWWAGNNALEFWEILSPPTWSVTHPNWEGAGRERASTSLKTCPSGPPWQSPGTPRYQIANRIFLRMSDYPAKKSQIPMGSHWAGRMGFSLPAMSPSF